MGAGSWDNVLNDAKKIAMSLTFGANPLGAKPSYPEWFRNLLPKINDGTITPDELKKVMDYATTADYLNIRQQANAGAIASAVGDVARFKESDFVNPQTQMENVLGKIKNEEINVTNDEGSLDTTALREQGEFGNWMADMLENSYKTGNLESDFYQTDESGNIVRDPDTNQPLYVPEMQTMVNYLTNGTPEDQQRWNEYRREMAASALSQGHTMNSGYYQDQVAQNVANRAAQAGQQVSDYITKEITSQYEYIQNSMANALQEMGYVTDAEGFVSSMRLNYEQIMEKYRQGIEEIRVQVEEQQMARRGDAFGAMIGGLASIALGFFL
jgi:hypothetical protein